MNHIMPTICARRAKIYLSLIGIASLGFLPVANARVTQIIIANTEAPTFENNPSFGSVGQYERIEGTITGEVDPKDPLNAIIVDIDRAPKNANGTVGYTASFQILRPMDLSKGNHRVIFELPNRGRTNVLGLFNDSGTPNTTTSSGDPGNAFLMNQGYTIVEGAWDTSAQGAGLFTVQFPIATNKDGSTITGPATEEFVIDVGSTPASQPLTYPAATADKSKASLTVRENYGDAPQTVPASGWDYIDTTALNAVKLTSGNFGGPGSFGPTALYEFTYVAKQPVVVGLGYAALRDLATFLRNAKTDDNGVTNPLRGDVQAIFTVCSSQPCRTTRDFVLLGFNEAEHSPRKASRERYFEHQKVFDGMLNWKGGGSGIFMNYRLAQPGRTHRQHIARWTPEIQFPFADVDMFDRVTGKFGSRLDRCRRTSTCPKIFEANSANEYWAKASSGLTTDGQGHDLDLDKAGNVRYYLFSSFPHGAGTAQGICQQPQNPLAPNQLLRALLLDLDDWVSTGREPPRNRIPRLADKTLAPALPQSGMGFPNIPGVIYNGIHHTGDLLQFGPQFDDGILTVLPPNVDIPYKVYVPKTDDDGNDIAGIRTPDVAVPVATYTGWALRAETHPEQADGCDASGQRLPFAATKTARLAVGDSRFSLQERYKDHATYVNLVTAAAQRLEHERLLLEQDVQAYIAAAEAAAVP
ncbi:MAG TPA: alpha/beta hydrolase domain-containing protein [Steroidobacteraceae bacterium]|nr:alpha/beta hydrolase domain-containing protein [Steroidobacteraceae bacterium]